MTRGHDQVPSCSLSIHPEACRGPRRGGRLVGVHRACSPEVLSWAVLCPPADPCCQWMAPLCHLSEKLPSQMFFPMPSLTPREELILWPFCPGSWPLTSYHAAGLLLPRCPLFTASCTSLCSSGFPTPPPGRRPSCLGSIQGSNLTGCQLSALDRPSIVSVPAAYCPKALLHSPTPLLRNQQDLSFLNMYFIISLAKSGLSCSSRGPRCGMQLLWLYTGSLVVACGLSCPAACGILVPQPKMELTYPVLQGGFLTTEVPSRFS